MKPWAIFIWGILFYSALNGKPLPSGNSSLLQDTLLSSIDSNTVWQRITADSALKPLSADILAFYKKRHFSYVWFTAKGLNEPARSFRNMLQRYNQAGINKFGMMWSAVKENMRRFESGTIDSTKIDSLRVLLELQLTGNFCQFINRNFPYEKTVAEEWFMPADTITIDSALKRIYIQKSGLDSTQFSKQLLLLTNQLHKYEKLRQSEWTLITLPVKAFKIGDKNHTISLIKKRITLLTDSAYTDTSVVFDLKLKNIVLLMQRNDGITRDGIIGREFMAMINTSPAERIKQLLINIQRFKWIPDIQYNENIVVNIPEFAMHVFQAGELCWSSAVVVGKPNTSTAVFSGSMKYIVFSPYWNVPPSIIKKEVIPSVKKNTGYIYKERLEFMQNGKTISPASIDWSKYPDKPFPYSIRQKPGKNNSLGLVKFLFPNEYDIYLHDTPSKNLFTSASRSFSHGCIRISEPQKFAEHLLRNDPMWTTNKIVSLMNGGKETWVILKPQVPVSINYFTAWVDNNGVLNFRKDVYGLDKELMKIYFK